MRENITKFGPLGRTIVSLSTIALLSGCAGTPLEHFTNQLSSFFKNAGGNETALNIVGENDETIALTPTQPMALPKPSRADVQENNTDLAHMLERVAETALASHNYGAAARIYRRSHDLAPSRIGPALGLARASAQTGDHRASIKAYQAVLTLKPTHPAALREISRKLMDLGAPKDAIPYLEAASLTDQDPSLHNELGIAHDLTGNHDAAQKIFRNALVLAPGDLTLRANLGRSLAFSGRYGEAVSLLQAVASSPKATKGHREALAMAHAAAGDVPAALKIIRPDVNGGTDAAQRAHYARIGDLVRTGNAGVRTELVAGTVQRDRYADRIGENRFLKPTATAAAPKEPDLLAVLASIDSRGNRPETTPAAPMGRELSKSVANIPAIATDSGPKSLYPARNDVAPATLNLTPDTPLPSETKTAVKSPKDRKVYHVQLAAYHTTQRAEKGWKQLVLKAPKLLDGMEPVIVTPDPKFNAGGLLRLRSQACNSRAEANSLCDGLKQRNLACLVVQSTIGSDALPPRNHAALAKE